MNLKFFVFNPRDPHPFAQEVATQTYDMWREVWLAALGELEGAKDLKSDDFTRQEQIGVLLEDGVAIGSVFFANVDLAKPMWRKDSYFSAWPEDTMVKIGREYSTVLVCSYFTLSQNYRRSSQGFNGKQLLSALAVEHFFNTESSAMVGTMRVNRGMHTLCYDLHALPIERDLEMHGVKVDLVLFDQKRLKSDLTLRGPMAREAHEIYAASQLEWLSRRRLRSVEPGSEAA